MPVKLGELLLKENMVSPQQLQEALNHQKLNGGKLGKAFVALGFVKDEEITEPPVPPVRRALDQPRSLRDGPGDHQDDPRGDGAASTRSCRSARRAPR